MRSIPAPHKRSASAVYLTLTALVVATTALVVFEQARGRRLVLEISKLGGDPRAPGADAVFGAVTVFAILIIFFAVSALAAAAAYLNWLIRARRSAERPSLFPVLVSWLVPVVNLVAPALLVNRLWRASHPPKGRRRQWKVLLTAWWLSWLAALTLVGVRLWPGVSGESIGLTGFGLPELTAVTVAALLCAMTVRQIGAIQSTDVKRRRRIAARRPTEHPDRQPELSGAGPAPESGLGPPEPVLPRIPAGDLPPLTRDDPEAVAPAEGGPHLGRVAVESGQESSSRGF